MRALFAKGAAASSLLSFLDVRTKIVVIAATAVATLAASGLAAQLVLFATTLVYALFLKRAKLLAVLYALMAAMMAIAAVCAWGLQTWLPQMGELNIHALVIPFLRGLSMMTYVCQRHQAGVGDASHQRLAAGTGDVYAAPHFVCAFDSGPHSFSCSEKFRDSWRCSRTQRHGLARENRAR